MSVSLEKFAFKQIRGSGLRLTQPRRQVAVVLAAVDQPLTPRELHQALGHYACDLVTVYRALADFERIGLVHRHEFGDGSTRYQLIGPDGGHAHYVVCRLCHHREPLDRCPTPQLEADAAALGFAHISHTLELFGICPRCQSMPCS
ncbi:transcriptional repressor [Halorhodospira abdelmalekii]|nr:transcriptional repressor [Halorhodospira abdelmalekii]